MAAKPCDSWLISLERMGLVQSYCGYCRNTPVIKTDVETILSIFGIQKRRNAKKVPLSVFVTPDGFVIELDPLQRLRYSRFLRDKECKEIVADLHEKEKDYCIKEAQHWINEVIECTEDHTPGIDKVVGRILGIPLFQYCKEKKLLSYVFSYPKIEQILGLYLLYGHTVEIGQWTIHTHGN